MSTALPDQVLPGAYKEGFHDDIKTLHKVAKGATHEVIDYMCDVKSEPDWMRQFRHRSLDLFLKQDLPAWMPGLRDIDYDAITYYMSPVDKSTNRWEDVPEEIRRTYDKLGIAKEEQKLLGGLGAQIDSEMAYHNIQESLSKQGVVFLSCDDGMKQYPEIFKEHFAKSIPPEDNKFAALNSAFWSGGSFVYVPKGVKCDIPLSVYFRINAEQFGQFERTLIVCDDDSFCHYVEGCSAPVYTTQLAPRRRRRDLRKRPGPLPIHDDSELVHRRLQPRDQARVPLQERRDGMGRRQPRLEAHGQISVVLHGRRRRARRNPQSRVRRQRNVAGCRRETRVLRAQLHRPHQFQIHQRPRRPRVLSRFGAGQRTGPELPGTGQLRRVDPRSGEPLGHVPRDGNRRRPRDGRTRGQRLERFRGTTLLPDEPRREKGRRRLDDRQRLHRADREGIADGICRRDQSAHQSANGRFSRVNGNGWPRTGGGGVAPIPVTPISNDNRIHSTDTGSHRLGRTGMAQIATARRVADIRETTAPTKRDVQWQRFDMRALKLDQIAVPADKPSITERLSTLPAALSKKGVLFCDMRTALTKHGDLLEGLPRQEHRTR